MLIWPSHWAYEAVPPLVSADSFKGQHPVDWFVRQKTEPTGVSEPSPPADALTLVRRLSLDLTGLLPDAEARQPPEQFEVRHSLQIRPP